MGTSRKARSLLFGVFDEQAVSVLAALCGGPLRFGQIRGETGLSTASLFRILARLDGAGFVNKTSGSYEVSTQGQAVLSLFDIIASRQSDAALRSVVARLREFESEYRRERRIFHDDPFWERTAEKPLVEVMAVRRMTGRESLLFHQEFQDAVRQEEWTLQHGSRGIR